MHYHKRTWLAINVVGGVAVLGSYVHGLVTHPETRNALWGTIPEELKAVYGVTMWLAAGGYFFFSYYFLVRTDAASVRFGRLGFGLDQRTLRAGDVGVRALDAAHLCLPREP